jgi:hypothetical protein
MSFKTNKEAALAARPLKKNASFDMRYTAKKKGGRKKK